MENEFTISIVGYISPHDSISNTSFRDALDFILTNLIVKVPNNIKILCSDSAGLIISTKDIAKIYGIEVTTIPSDWGDYSSAILSSLDPLKKCDMLLYINPEFSYNIEFISGCIKEKIPTYRIVQSKRVVRENT